MQYQQIIGHQTTKEQLKNIVNTRKISHAYIFDGPEGIGKKMMAHAFASSIVCDSFQTEPCGKCKHCQLSFGNSHPDIISMDLTVDKNGEIRESISVEAVRDLKKDVYIKPFFADRKIYIIEDAQKMTAEAQNALLKVFEEPPQFATFILLTNGLSKILPTILSRGVIIKFQPLAKEELKYFAAQRDLQVPNMDLLVSLSGGRAARFLELAEQEYLIEVRNEALKAFAALVNGSQRNAINQMFLLMKEHQDRIEEVIHFLETFVSDIGLICAGNHDKIVHADQISALQKMAERLNHRMLSNLLRCLLSFSEGQQKNQNYLAGVMNLLVGMWEEIHG